MLCQPEFIIRKKDFVNEKYKIPILCSKKCQFYEICMKQLKKKQWKTILK